MDARDAAEPAPSVEFRLALADLYVEYADILDSGELDRWPELFTDPCLYQVLPRENFERGLPLATVRCESRGMLRDRVIAARETQMYVPRWLRHVVAPPRIVAFDGDTAETRANYAVFETQTDEPTRVLNVGVYRDKVVRDGGRLRFRERVCVFDSVLIPTSLVHPV